MNKRKDNVFQRYNVALHKAYNSFVTNGYFIDELDQTKGKHGTLLRQISRSEGLVEYDSLRKRSYFKRPLSETEVNNVVQKMREYNKKHASVYLIKTKKKSKLILEKEFEVQKLTNGRGHKHLVVITESAIEDIHIGTIIIVPYAEGFREPNKVLLQIDENGLPKRANDKFAIVLKYIYE